MDRRTFLQTTIAVVVLACAASTGDSTRAAADPMPPGTAACTALGAEKIAALAAITTTYDAGSARATGTLHRARVSSAAYWCRRKGV